MPERFTRTFAERLDQQSPFSVREAADERARCRTAAVVCPGGKCVEVDCLDGQRVLARVVDRRPRDRYTPSADRLFRSAARALGNRVIGVVLTGMGDDGAQRRGRRSRTPAGTVYVESEETAVMYGMPRCAKRHRRGRRSAGAAAAGRRDLDLA